MSAPLALGAHERRALDLQRRVGCLLGPLWIPACVAIMRFGLGWRIVDAQDTRREFARLRRESTSPLLVCANHLTMADSFLIAMALGSPWYFVTHYASLPWNTPAWENFANTWWSRCLSYVMKCVPVKRGGDRRDVGVVLESITDRLGRGEVALIFPEGGRTRSARVDTDAVTYGVGRIVKSLPGCRVLCVYMRGDRQHAYTEIPARGDRFRVSLECIEPKSDSKGLRGSVEILRQILGQLVEMELRYFDDRQ